MKKNINKSIFEKFGLLFIGLILVMALYGGLSILKLQKENQTLNQKTIALETKIINLEDQLIDNQNGLAQMTQDFQTVSQKLTKNNSELAYYKNLTLELKNATEEKTVQPVQPQTGDQEIKLEPPKTVVKKVYVKEKPKYEASVIVEGLGSYKVQLKSGDSAYKILKRASEVNGFDLEYQVYDFGVFVTSIGGVSPASNQYWAFYYNGNFSQVGASDQTISTGDTTFWQLESF